MATLPADIVAASDETVPATKSGYSHQIWVRLQITQIWWLAPFSARTLVTTWPEKIVRPGYWMDGVRWCAGFADEHSIVKGTKTPQFGIAFGVSAGKHDVKVAEWEWPAVPPAPPRQSLR